MSNSVRKDIKKLLKTLAKSGWRIEKRSHTKLFSPCGKYIILISESPSDMHAINQIKRQLKQRGYSLK